MILHNALYPRSNVDRLYIPRSEGGGRLLSAKDTVNLAELRLQEYVKMNDERMISAARSADEATDWETAMEIKNDVKKRKKHERETTGKQRCYMGNPSCRQNI